MGMFTSFDVNASGMTAERFRMDIISENIANANTTRTEDGTPYVRKVVTFEEKQYDPDRDFSHYLDTSVKNLDYRRSHMHNGQYDMVGVLTAKDKTNPGEGVKVGGVYEDDWTEMVMVYDPAHPDADENGYVTYPNVNIVTEMTNMIDTSRAYEANATAFEASKSMMSKGLEINGN